MNELATKKEFENKNLQDATISIYRLQDNANMSLLSIAGIAGEVAKNKSYEEDGFKKPQEWLMQTFGYKKSTAYSMIKIANDFLELEVSPSGMIPIYHSVFRNAETDEDFTLTQLEKLLPLGKEKVIELMSYGSLKFESSVKDIRELVSDVKALETKDEKETETETKPEKEKETETETKPEKEKETETEKEELLSTIKIYNNCITVRNGSDIVEIQYEFSDLNKIIKDIRNLVKKYK